MKYTDKNNLLRLLSVAILAFATQFSSGITSFSHAAVPSYDVQFIGGFQKAMNNNGQAVGWISVDGIARAWVSTGNVQELLPVPQGWHSQANDINDDGVVVGSAGGDGNPDGAVQWQPTVSGYEMVTINTPVDDTGSIATAINNIGDIVGTRTFLTEIRTGVFTFVTRGFLLENNGIFTENLSDLGFTALPADINDAGQIVGGSLRMTAGIVEDLGVPTVPEGETRYSLAFLNTINNIGQVGATTVLASSLDANRTASRYTDGAGWQVLSFVGSHDAAYGINDQGDISFEASFLCPNGGAGSPGVFIDGVGTYCIQDLLTSADWVIHAASFDNDINNNGQILVNGSNSVTGESGALLLTPAGSLPPPSAPEGLAATVHEADAQQPWNAIQLSWIDTSFNEQGFAIERRILDSNTWNEIDTVGANAKSYNDKNLDLGVTYEYRVFAVGLAGNSAPSNIVSATSPSTAIDTEAPIVSFVSPVNGEQVTGRVQIDVNVTDNVAVTNVRIRTLVNSSEITICDVSDPSSDTVSCKWNTNKLPSGDYPLNATVSDAMGNFSSASINVSFITSTKGNGGGKGKK